MRATSLRPLLRADLLACLPSRVRPGLDQGACMPRSPACRAQPGFACLLVARNVSLADLAVGAARFQHSMLAADAIQAAVADLEAKRAANMEAKASA